MSTFGTHFRVTTYGESHCASVGCIVDGVPPGMALRDEDVQVQLTRRRPGQSALTTPVSGDGAVLYQHSGYYSLLSLTPTLSHAATFPVTIITDDAARKTNHKQRDEKDRVQIQSGVEKGVTLGTPLAMLVRNQDQRPHDYTDETLDLFPRPSHADFTYLEKYGLKASSGGGRSSARETIGECSRPLRSDLFYTLDQRVPLTHPPSLSSPRKPGRVAAGAVAEKYLAEAFGIEIVAFVSSVGKVRIPRFPGEQLSAPLASAVAATNGSASSLEKDAVAAGAANNAEPSAASAAAINGLASSTLDNEMQTDALTEEEAEEPLSKEFRHLLATVTRKQVDETEIRCPHPEAAGRMREVSGAPDQPKRGSRENDSDVLLMP